MEISKDFEEFFELLNEHNVRYLVVGGYAFAIHARPRFTNDLDVFIEPDRSNASNLLKALEEFGFGDVGITLDDLQKVDQVIQLGYPPYRIDLMTSISNVRFADAWDRKVTARFGKQTVYYIGKEDFIASKKGAGRKRDLQDLDELL